LKIRPLRCIETPSTYHPVTRFDTPEVWVRQLQRCVNVNTLLRSQFLFLTFAEDGCNMGAKYSLRVDKLKEQTKNCFHLCTLVLMKSVKYATVMKYLLSAFRFYSYNTVLLTFWHNDYWAMCNIPIHYICTINQHDTLFVLTLLNDHTATCYGPVCGPSSGSSECMCGKWYLFMQIPFATHTLAPYWWWTTNEPVTCTDVVV
jgi:hypothetical protein